MVLLKNRIYIMLMAGLLLPNNAYSQSTNMVLPNQVGSYAINSKNNTMQLPNQVGVYQPQRFPTTPNTAYNPHMMGQQRKPVVDYSKQPTMNRTIYENVNGYKTPNRYSLQNANMKRINDQKNIPVEYDSEYYLSLSYGFGSFDGTGLENDSIVYPPMNEISEGLGDPKLLSVGFGIQQNRNVRIELNYTNISGLHYEDNAYATNQWCGPWDYDGFFYDCAELLPVSGGGISSNALMLNVEVPLTDLIGTIFDGFVTPYIGGGVGISFNTLSDYSVYDEYGDAEIPATTDGNPFDSDGNFTGGWFDYNGTITHFGATTNNIAWNVRAGLSFNLDKKTFLDLYYQMGNYGKVESHDSIYYSYETVNIVDPIQDSSGGWTCTDDALNEGYIYIEESGWCESSPYLTEGTISDAKEKGTIETTEIGVKLRLIF